MCNEKLEVPVNSVDIVKCYRVGSKKNSNRPVIVRLDSQNKRNLLLKNKKKLKGQKIGVMEDLDKERLMLYKMAQEKTSRKAVFTMDGNIFVYWENRKHLIKNEIDLLNL